MATGVLGGLVPGALAAESDPSASVDVELLRPALGDGGVYGIEGAGVPDKWAWRVGLATQYERAPVLILTEGLVTSRPVSDRVGGWAGFSLGLGRRVAVQAFVPLQWQSGDDTLVSADGAGLGDPRLGARWGLVHTQLFDATLRADLYIPLGRKDAWMGETSTRAAFGASAALNGGFGAVLLDVGLVARPLETPQPRLDWGPAVELGLGVRADLLPGFSVGGGWVARAVLAGLATQDGELASEVLVNARYDVTPTVSLSGGAGVGVQPGVGVPTARGFVTATFADAFSRRPPKPEPVVEAPPTKEAVTALLEEEIPGVTDVAPPPPPPLVRIFGDELAFREEIAFAPNSAEILPSSHELLDAIASLLASEGRIAHLAIEGHASEEGDLAYNWDLSDRRARAVWEALLVEGVSPQRMSWRGVGEVIPAPVAKGAPPAPVSRVAAENRRVVLRIARRLAQGEALPETPATTLLPWSGEAVALEAVSIPEFTAPKPEFVDPTFFDEQEEEE